nr:immunoglobulin light chain junction region [Macaca mulatta]
DYYCLLWNYSPNTWVF